MGKQQEGEGVTNLAQGFFYAGANSVASTLWNTNDKTAAKISLSLYDYLKDGYSKTQALQKAKLDYLDSSSLSEASPYYWAPMILMGDEQAMPWDFSNARGLLVMLAMALLILFGPKIRKQSDDSN